MSSNRKKCLWAVLVSDGYNSADVEAIYSDEKMADKHVSINPRVYWKQAVYDFWVET
jgi:hypothetical protein